MQNHDALCSPHSGSSWWNEHHIPLSGYLCRKPVRTHSSTSTSFRAASLDDTLAGEKVAKEDVGREC